MNEKFLSRGKREDTGKWVGGYYVELPEEQHGEWLHLIIGLDGQYNRIIPETAGRYTGLIDKNGKKIFEGDIISYEDEAPGQYEYHDSIIANFGVIEFGDGGFYFTNSIAATMNDLLLGNDVLDCEVIGNIHDNPELLE